MNNPIAHPRRAKAMWPGPIPRRAHGASRKLPAAFTLIEILVVISIIALLAALVVYILPAANERKVRNRIKTELAGLETAIDRYHQKRGFYPPDNPGNDGKPPLYHELTGTDINPTLSNQLGVVGILNADAHGENFFKNLKPSAYVVLNQIDDVPSNQVTVLLVPYKGTNEPNLWHYNSSNPKYNSDSYDLWANVVIAGKTVTIGNWK